MVRLTAILLLGCFSILLLLAAYVFYDLYTMQREISAIASQLQ